MTPITESDLLKMAPHVQWEFEMLCLAAERAVCSGPHHEPHDNQRMGNNHGDSDHCGPALRPSAQHKTVESLMFEALLIHLRNLLHFLYANGQKGDFLRVLPAT